MSIGVLCAFIALIGWGFGDFFIQKTTRMIGPYKTLFFICAAGAIALAPFVARELTRYGASEWRAIAVLSVIVLIFAIVLFEALRRGKLSVVESVVAVELPLTVMLGVFVGGESLTFSQFLLFLVIFIGVALAAAARLDHLHYHRRIFEKGVLLAFIASFLSALTNFYIGTYSQEMSPLFVIWATHSILALVCGAYILVRGEAGSLLRDIRRYPFAIIGQSAFDNIAWIGYAFATSFIPISISVMISESYIALAALLGVFLGGERINRHQIIGAIVAFCGVVVLASTL